MAEYYEMHNEMRCWVIIPPVPDVCVSGNANEKVLLKASLIQITVEDLEFPGKH